MAAVPSGADAARLSARERLLASTIDGLQLKIETADRAGEPDMLSSLTAEVLDSLLVAALDRDRHALEYLVVQYADDVSSIQAEQADLKCGFSLLWNTSLALASMLQEAASDSSPVCMAINVSNNAADIIIYNITYRICLIDNSVTPDQAAREVLVQRQIGVETYDFLTNALDLLLCTPAPTVVDYINLLLNFLTIVPPSAP